jgi:hypothetical protein
VTAARGDDFLKICFEHTYLIAGNNNICLPCLYSFVFHQLSKSTAAAHIKQQHAFSAQR